MNSVGPSFKSECIFLFHNNQMWFASIQWAWLSNYRNEFRFSRKFLGKAKQPTQFLALRWIHEMYLTGFTTGGFRKPCGNHALCQ